MTLAKSTRKTRSDKFPLTLHSTGQYCKKIRGKLYYFGVNKQEALEKYLKHATLLHAAPDKSPNIRTNSISLKTLCNTYLNSQHQKVETGELTQRYFPDQTKSLKSFVDFIGICASLDEISTTVNKRNACGLIHAIGLQIDKQRNYLALGIR